MEEMLLEAAFDGEIETVQVRLRPYPPPPPPPLSHPPPTYTLY